MAKKNEKDIFKNRAIPIIVLISLSGILIFSAVNRSLDSTFNNNANADLHEAASNNSDSIESNQSIKQVLQSNTLDFQEVRSILNVSLEEFINSYGEPINREMNYNDYFEDNTVTLHYRFCEAMFIPIYNQKDQLTLSYIIIKESDIKGPYGISVGDNIQSVFSKFPKEKYEKDYIKNVLSGNTSEAFGPNTEITYISEDIRDVGLITYDAQGQITVVEYMINFETGGVTRLRFEVTQNKIAEILIWQGYM